MENALKGTPNGIKVRFSGFKLSPRLPRILNPWKGTTSSGVRGLFFQDERGIWYIIFAFKGPNLSPLNSPDRLKEDEEDNR
jgi:hypothetical protein